MTNTSYDQPDAHRDGNPAGAGGGGSSTLAYSYRADGQLAITSGVSMKYLYG